MMVRIKYAGEAHALPPLIEATLKELPNEAQLLFPDAVVAVPTSKPRLKQRGFDQAVIIAKEVARTLHLSMLSGALKRRRKDVPQVSLTRKERLTNLQGAFRATGVFGRSVLLVDDVVTTGGTILAASAALEQAGARRVVAFTLARTPAHHGA
jgi:ComF family protein